MNELTSEDINDLLIKRGEELPETHSSVRKLVDNVIAPATMLTIGAGASAAKALGRLQHKENLRTVV